MGMIDWMQSKLNGWKKESSISTKTHTQNEPGKPESSDWHHGLLAIGTLGNDDLGEDVPAMNNLEHGENPSSSQEHLHGLSQEELDKLQDKINSMLLDKQQVGSAAELEETIDLPLDNLFNHELKNNHGRQLLRANSYLGRKSLSFLLKKIFVCKSGFAPTPSLRDPIPETRMEKILRTLLHKKIHPQGSSSTLTKKKYLRNRHMPEFSNENEIEHNASKNTKWVKTDSEYIVLEI